MFKVITDTLVPFVKKYSFFCHGLAILGEKKSLWRLLKFSTIMLR